jgi:hypothetical protein
MGQTSLQSDYRFTVNGELLSWHGLQLSLDDIRNNMPYHWQKL